MYNQRKTQKASETCKFIVPPLVEKIAANAFRRQKIVKIAFRSRKDSRECISQTKVNGEYDERTVADSEESRKCLPNPLTVVL